MVINKQRLKILMQNKTPCEFHWLDVTGNIRKEINEIKDVPIISLLEPIVTYGIVWKYDTMGIIIATEILDGEIDYGVIPHNLITNIRTLEYKKEAKKK